MGLRFCLFALILPFFSFCQQFKALDAVNSPARETNLAISPNGKHLYFMSERGGLKWPEKNDFLDIFFDDFEADIWVSTKRNGVWEAPEPLNYPINTHLEEDEPNIVKNGQYVVFQSWRDDWIKSGGPYYQARLDGKKWTNPVGLGGKISEFFVQHYRIYEKRLREWQRGGNSYGGGFNLRGTTTFFGTDGMAVSPNGRIFIVALTNYKRGNPVFDLFISRKNDKDEWSYPKLMPISTNNNEIAVFIAADNKTLYFASDRSGGQGGYDIYKTELIDDNQCGSIKNIGPPYNTKADDYGLIVNAAGDHGYMVRNGDIYEFVMKEEVRPERQFIVNGIVKDQENNALEADIQLKQLSATSPIEKTENNRNSGEYTFTLPWKEGRYSNVVKLKDGREKGVEFEIKADSKSPLELEVIFQNTEAVKALEESNIAEGRTIVVDKLFFQADSTEIEQASYPALDAIAEVLISRPNLVVEIGGHTNGIPPDDYCDRLSEARAKAVFEYLVAKKVPSGQLQYKGYGKRQPIFSNRTKYGRERNQRVELKVLKTK